MQLPMYQLDAFASRVFAGNPAAIVPLERWLPDDVMQAIASENNLSETAFFVPRGEDYDICWFTPVAEIDLAGHPTLAAAHVILNLLDTRRDQVRFHSRKSGALTVTRESDRLSMDFPARPPAPKPDLGDVASALRRAPSEVLAARDGVAVFESTDVVKSLSPDFAKVAALDCMGLIATAPGAQASGVDFVSRFFAPRSSINEDPVTGSAHCSLIPYWAKRFGKSKMFARQVSKRGGEIWCEHRGERVTIAGQCVLFFEATIRV